MTKRKTIEKKEPYPGQHCSDCGQVNGHTTSCIHHPNNQPKK